MSDFFYIKVSDDKMVAEVYCKEQYNHIDMKIEMPMLIDFLKENKVIYGVDKKGVELILNRVHPERFPIVIANGKQSKNGDDGNIIFHKQNNVEVKRGEDWNFRDVMQIPTVNKGEKLATISLPTKGIDGKNVRGTVLRARPGKPVPIKAGKNGMPPIKSFIKVNLGTPSTGSKPTVIANNPTSNASIPFVIEPSLKDVTKLNPNNAKAKYSNGPKFSAKAAIGIAVKINKIALVKAPMEEEVIDNASARPASPFFVIG